MFDFTKADVTVEEQSNSYGRFVFKPLEPGYGTTLGNSLRRTLLSSLPGAAVSMVRIDGVTHEFSFIPGVTEDVTELVLNIKGLALKNHSTSGEPKTITIDAHGDCEVLASSIIVPADIEICNPELHIATLNGADAHLHIEMTVTTGAGYVSSDKNKNSSLIGIIPVDSLYTPVTRVNFLVDNYLYNERTDYDRLTLEVWTNGTIKPEEAVSTAAKILIEHLNLFVNLSENAKHTEIKMERVDEKREKTMDLTIEDLDLSVRSYNCLKRAGINTVEDLATRTEEDMRKVRNMGQKSLEEVLKKMAELGLHLRPSDE